ncbi:hypothetical protein [Streptomyces fungicidicus]|uniref:hypothetical protein n=1 Tax=Streptomyces fungicidicus TaxID=68203 RepID=UPI003D70CAA8
MGEPGVDVGLDVPVGSPGEFVADGFVSGAGLGLLQCAELAQRLELFGAGRDPGGLVVFGFPGGGGRSVGGELRQAADVVGQVLVPRVLPASNRVSSRAAAAAPASILFARRRTTRRPMRAGSTGSRGVAMRGASGLRTVRRGGQGVVVVGLYSWRGFGSGSPSERCTTTRQIAL